MNKLAWLAALAAFCVGVRWIFTADGTLWLLDATIWIEREWPVVVIYAVFALVIAAVVLRPRRVQSRDWWGA